MPLSMRAQTLANKTRVQRRHEERKRRAKFFRLINEGQSALQASIAVGVSRTTAYRIKAAKDRSDSATLQKLLNPEQYHAGRKPILSPFEENLIVQRTLYAAEHGFAVDNTTISTVHARIAADRKEKYASGVPSADTIRAFRARNRSFAYRVAENVTTARLAAENKEHISSLENVLKKIGSEHPDLFEDPRRIWNWDETSVSGEYGRKVRCYASSNSHNGGARRSIRDAGKHVTAGIAVAACGNKAPLFLIASGKRVVKSWKEPLSAKDFSSSQGVPHWLCHEGWFPSDTVLQVTKCGSVDKQIIVNVVRHINDHARKFIDSSKHILLLLDGHSSRNGTEWIEACKLMNIIVVRLPANTTHILQPCDQYVNRTFQTTVRKTRDELLSMSHLSWANTAYKVKLAVAGFQAITGDDIRKSFIKCGLWPMDYRFLQLFPSKNTVSAVTVASDNNISNWEGYYLRRHDRDNERTRSLQLQERIHKLTDGTIPAGRCLAEVAAILNRDYRVHDILIREITPPKTASATLQSRKRGGVVQGAAELTSGASKAPLEVSKSVILSGNRQSSSIKNCEPLVQAVACEKENTNPILRVNEDRYLSDAFGDDLDDIPIASWPKHQRSTGIGFQRSAREDASRSAAKGLVILSQLR